MHASSIPDFALSTWIDFFLLNFAMGEFCGEIGITIANFKCVFCFFEMSFHFMIFFSLFYSNNLLPK